MLIVSINNILIIKIPMLIFNLKLILKLKLNLKLILKLKLKLNFH